MRGWIPRSLDWIGLYIAVFGPSVPLALSTYLSIYPPTYLPIYLSSYLYIYLSTYLSTYLPTSLRIDIIFWVKQTNIMALIVMNK